ncbi:MAG: hypothetical protein MR991_07365 [Clostridiales bacterium]|nr:hypothetical protein [Clostridiales bacterium]MDD7035675.1 hypothetical protein [Bacillota bacterium]MDY2920677.1 hypothetical protein [Lentihominibacter sp.]
MKDMSIRTSLCEMQGKLFEMSGMEGYDSECFIRTFMNSDLAVGLDSDFDFTHWAGKEYLLERMKEEYPEGFRKQGNTYDGETLYWAGYLYRYWNFYTGESSRTIYKTADAKSVNSMYPGYHTLDIEMAIDRFRQV